MVGEDVIVATINEFDKRIVKGIVTMMGTIIADTLDTEEQIEETKASLDRINGWINSCDSKAGTVLAMTGVLLTIIFTNDGVAEIVQRVAEYYTASKFLYSFIYWISWDFCIHAVPWNCAINYNINCKD